MSDSCWLATGRASCHKNLCSSSPLFNIVPRGQPHLSATKQNDGESGRTAGWSSRLYEGQTLKYTSRYYHWSTSLSSLSVSVYLSVCPFLLSIRPSLSVTRFSWSLWKLSGFLSGTHWTSESLSRFFTCGMRFLLPAGQQRRSTEGFTTLKLNARMVCRHTRSRHGGDDEDQADPGLPQVRIHCVSELWERCRVHTRGRSSAGRAGVNTTHGQWTVSVWYARICHRWSYNHSLFLHTVLLTSLTLQTSVSSFKFLCLIGFWLCFHSF